MRCPRFHPEVEALGGGVRRCSRNDLQRRVRRSRTAALFAIRCCSCRWSSPPGSRSAGSAWTRASRVRAWPPISRWPGRSSRPPSSSLERPRWRPARLLLAAAAFALLGRRSPVVAPACALDLGWLFAALWVALLVHLVLTFPEGRPWSRAAAVADRGGIRRRGGAVRSSTRWSSRHARCCSPSHRTQSVPAYDRPDAGDRRSRPGRRRGHPRPPAGARRTRPGAPRAVAAARALQASLPWPASSGSGRCSRRARTRRRSRRRRAGSPSRSRSASSRGSCARGLRRREASALVVELRTRCGGKPEGTARPSARRPVARRRVSTRRRPLRRFRGPAGRASRRTAPAR